ncbi:ShlB/FhaC/HecB family hemolysin secretion/activation protein [Erwinia sp. HDF1-3R]|uniref:ShlB/FhaC/HecB family hemolysin secretion/activation protein n=1 Tax=Erwinia sp. HDF1-3R TaxID=3141543 RepID=UPI0031F4CDAA
MNAAQFVALTLTMTALSSAFSSTLEQREINQSVQDKVREESSAQAGKNVRSDDKIKDPKIIDFPEESPCIVIKKITVENVDKFPYRLYLKQFANQGAGRCLGIKGATAISTALQNRLISYGYITTRVEIPEQDVKNGTLRFTLIPGVVDNIQLTQADNRLINLFTTFPMKKGSLLNLRDLEQGLENMQRVYGAQARIRLSPGESEGGSEINVTHAGSRLWRMGLWLDDSGSRYTGRYQAGGTLYLDNPGGINDNLMVSAGGNLFKRDARGSSNQYFYYSVPFGYWTFDIFGAKSRFEQRISGNYATFRFHGQSNSLSVGAKRIIARSGNSKTTLGVELQKKRSRNYIETTELSLQQRNSTALKTTLKHQRYLEWGDLDGAVSLQRNLDWFNAQPEAARRSSGYSPQARIATLSTGLIVPFTFAQQNMSYQTNYLLQISPDRLTPQEKFVLGNRWAVRGFDGEFNLNASQGYLWGNTLNFNYPAYGFQLYLGVDYGRVMGRGSELLSGRQLMGGVVGINGWKWNTGYNLFVGAPLYKPDQFQTDSVNLGFSINWQY